MLQLFFKYKYWVAFGFFGLWMLFFDSNNLFYRISVADEISDYEKSINMHKTDIADLQKQKSELLGNQRNLEKYARERYLMKKDNEDLFVIVRDTTDQ